MEALYTNQGSLVYRTPGNQEQEVPLMGLFTGVLMTSCLCVQEPLSGAAEKKGTYDLHLPRVVPLSHTEEIQAASSPVLPDTERTVFGEVTVIDQETTHAVLTVHQKKILMVRKKF
jgi:hypothetical protein